LNCPKPIYSKKSITRKPSTPDVSSPKLPRSGTATLKPDPRPKSLSVANLERVKFFIFILFHFVILKKQNLNLTFLNSLEAKLLNPVALKNLKISQVEFVLLNMILLNLQDNLLSLNLKSLNQSKFHFFFLFFSSNSMKIQHYIFLFFLSSQLNFLIKLGFQKIKKNLLLVSVA